MSDAVELTLIVPVKDEEEAIAPFVEQVVPIIEAIDDPVARSFEILFIDDGSTDRTMERIRAAQWIGLFADALRDRQWLRATGMVVRSPGRLADAAAAARRRRRIGRLLSRDQSARA